MNIHILTIPALKDNLSYLVYGDSNQAIVIDPSEAPPIMKALEDYNLNLKLILNTHHHHDHVGGNLALQKKYSVPVWCSAIDLDRIPGASRGFKENESFDFEKIKFQTLLIPGHTKGQIAYYIPEARALFVGDTLFAMGCGRLFEGTPKEMWTSLNDLTKFPMDTRLYFGHEYTERNALFTLKFDPENPEIEKRLDVTRKALTARQPAPAPTLESELKINLFLCPQKVAQALNLQRANELEIFTELRKRRDHF